MVWKYYDFSESVLIPKYYYDHHHLNSAGVDYFAENFLKRCSERITDNNKYAL